MGAKSPRNVQPRIINEVELSRAILVLFACSDIALDQLNTISESGSSVYRHKVKAALKNSQKELESLTNDFPFWGEEEVEKEYRTFTSLVELMGELITETPANKLSELHHILTTIKNGEYRTVGEEHFNKIDKEPATISA